VQNCWAKRCQFIFHHFSRCLFSLSVSPFYTRVSAPSMFTLFLPVPLPSIPPLTSFGQTYSHNIESLVTYLFYLLAPTLVYLGTFRPFSTGLPCCKNLISAIAGLLFLEAKVLFFSSVWLFLSPVTCQESFSASTTSASVLVVLVLILIARPV
jgi:hypothetical protein